eukprot:2351832-Alexandrium_andersonii.AAC.1
MRLPPHRTSLPRVLPGGSPVALRRLPEASREAARKLPGRSPDPSRAPRSSPGLSAASPELFRSSLDPSKAP